MFRLETDPDGIGRSVAEQLRDVPKSTRRALCAAACEAALSRTGVTYSVLHETVKKIRKGDVLKSGRDAVTAIVCELDVVAWDLADMAARRI
ncbi:hypothetical protein O3597_23920 [Verrucosispora sp. WMMA2044]|uniref:Uncharacterized protein n=1 Tax=Verrucosispora sioxanthis TaxID=2499994 RepID=A0A6M1L769_9ACTN|nr:MULTISPECIES: hypothetical protein [Micromonospora]NEE63643.1 hypothetical protein [Verrucosispora sioxanthis]NGM12753.1 hypothetical protein [Verrucosispora sioxanthis]WBB48122.1 hypothetical protein O3597_23920 [Verrucosispora sp. WMMA2044]